MQHKMEKNDLLKRKLPIFAQHIQFVFCLACILVSLVSFKKVVAEKSVELIPPILQTVLYSAAERPALPYPELATADWQWALFADNPMLGVKHEAFYYHVLKDALQQITDSQSEPPIETRSSTYIRLLAELPSAVAAAQTGDLSPIDGLLNSVCITAQKEDAVWAPLLSAQAMRLNGRNQSRNARRCAKKAILLASKNLSAVAVLLEFYFILGNEKRAQETLENAQELIDALSPEKRTKVLSSDTYQTIKMNEAYFRQSSLIEPDHKGAEAALMEVCPSPLQPLPVELLSPAKQFEASMCLYWIGDVADKREEGLGFEQVEVRDLKWLDAVDLVTLRATEEEIMHSLVETFPLYPRLKSEYAIVLASHASYGPSGNLKETEEIAFFDRISSAYVQQTDALFSRLDEDDPAWLFLVERGIVLQSDLAVQLRYIKSGYFKVIKHRREELRLQELLSSHKLAHPHDIIGSYETLFQMFLAAEEKIGRMRPDAKKRSLVLLDLEEALEGMRAISTQWKTVDPTGSILGDLTEEVDNLELRLESIKIGK